VDRRLLALAVAVTVAAGAAPLWPPSGILLTLLLPVAGIAGVCLGGPAAAAACLAPGAGLLLARAPEALAEYAASGVAGVVLGLAVRRGVSPARALAWGTVPFAAWTLALSVSGFDPVPPEMAQAFARALAVEGGAAGTASRTAEAEVWIGLVRRTWVGAEIVFFAGALALAYRVAAAFFADRSWPRFGPFRRFDLPDGLVGVLLVALGAAAAAQRGAPEAFASISGNLLVGAGVLYAVRGIAIQAFWLSRAGLGAKASAALLAAGGFLLLPVFPLAAAAVGLFDTWFDFRRLRGPEGGSHLLSVFRHSSSDDRT
jgi:hypothetical protein